jgi:hypothetical protein
VIRDASHGEVNWIIKEKYNGIAGSDGGQIEKTRKLECLNNVNGRLIVNKRENGIILISDF